MKKDINYHLYLVTDAPEKCRYGLLETVRRAVQGGVTVVQYRSGETDRAKMLAEVLPLQEYLRSVGVPLIINNDVELAVEIGADGVHVGQGDMPVAEARQLIGPDKVLGLSVTNAAEMAAVDTALVDYVGVGPVFPTQTKPDAAQDLGMQGWLEVAGCSPLPVVAIGGLDRVRTAAVRATGLAAGVAVVSYICAADAPAQAARELL